MAWRSRMGEEIILEEDKDVRSTFSFEENAVVFRDYDLTDDGSIKESPCAVFSIPNEFFEAVVKSWLEKHE